MAVKLKKWDSAEHLRTEEDIAEYWAACLCNEIIAEETEEARKRSPDGEPGPT